MQSWTFGAQAAKVSWVLGIAFHINDFIILWVNDHSAANAAVATSTFSLFD